MTGTVLANLAACNKPDKPVEASTPVDSLDSSNMKNWAGNLTYSTSNLFEPLSVDDVQKMVLSCNKARALGTRHCFNTIADSKDNLISTRNLYQILSISKVSKTVTVSAGARYGELCTYLHKQGFAIPNLASLPHISVAGACATATHGSGVKNGNLATPVSAIEFVNAQGEIVSLSREKDEDFQGAVVGLGALGVLTKITLDLIPAFSMRQDVYLNLPIEQLEAHFDEIMSAGYSVSLFYDWQTSNINQVWIKGIVNDGESYAAEKTFFGATLATRNVHPIIEISAENCTEQMSVPGPWYERLPHFKMGFTPSSGEELQAEYFVPRQHAFKAIQAVETLRKKIKPLLMITEIRTIAADNFWMSPCYHQDSVAIHFTLNPDWDGVRELLPLIEEKLAPFNVKPHWGKLFTMSPETLQSRYEKLADFKQLVNKYDPKGKFRNEFLSRNIFESNA